MQYTIILSSQEINVISKMLQEWPYKIVAPVLDNLGKQVDIQNTENIKIEPDKQ